MTYHIQEKSGKVRIVRDSRIESIKRVPDRSGDVFLLRLHGESGVIAASDVFMLTQEGNRKSVVKEAPPQFLQRLVVKAPGKPDMVRSVAVEHDEGCPCLTGGECNCDPELEITVRHVAPAGQGES